MTSNLQSVELDEAESYDGFANQTEKVLVSVDAALPEYVRLCFGDSPAIMVRLSFIGMIYDLAAYRVEYLIKKA